MMSPAACAGIVQLVMATGTAPMAAVTPRLDARRDTALLGAWVLNRDLSDDPREQLRELRRTRRGGRGMGGMGDRGGMGGRPRGGGERDGPGTGEGGTRRRAIDAVLDGPPRLTISEREGELVFDAGGGRVVFARPDGKKVKDLIDDVEIKAAWKDRRLVVEREFASGASVVEAYSISPQTGQLLVTVELDLPRAGEVAWRLVYDRAPPESP